MEILNNYIWTPFMVFSLGFLFVKIAGKRSVAQMTAFDLMFIQILGTAITEPIVSKSNWVASWYSLVIAIFYLALSRLAIVNKFKHYVNQSPTVLIRNGDIDEQGLKKVRLTVEDLLGILRVQGYTNKLDVELAVMEVTGQVSIIPKSDKRPLQPSDIKLQPSPTFVSIPLIMDGEIVKQNLRYIKKDLDWLYSQMQTKNLSKEDLNKITLADYNQEGQVEFDIRNQNGNENRVYN